MAGKNGRWCAALVLLLGLLAPSPVLAGPYFGDWGWCWHQSAGCPRGDYCPLHYWMPTIYRVRGWVHPSNLDQYPAGPSPAVAATYLFDRSGCIAKSPAPTFPYADPSGYYGVPTTPP
jgi:hypothetical protein